MAAIRADRKVGPTGMLEYVRCNLCGADDYDVVYPATVGVSLGME